MATRAVNVACVKCATERTTDAIACGTCGLAVDRSEAYVAAQADATARVPDVVRVAWDAAVADWDDPTKHDAFLHLVSLQGEFAYAAARYRSRGQDPIAVRELARVARAAEVTLRSTGGVPETTSFRVMITVLFVLVVVLATSLVYVYIRQETR